MGEANAKSALEKCGNFIVLDTVGRGGTAECSRAVRLRKGTLPVEQRALIKRLRPDRSAPHFVEAFKREGQLAGSLRHQNLAQLMEADPSGQYLAYELVDGSDLHKLLQSTKQLPPLLATHIVVEVAKALRYMHTLVRRGKAAGVVHCDVSPANILISFWGEVKLADLGVAQPTATTARRAGKIPYMAPEAWFSGELIDGRADLFSLGVCMYEMLAGHRPAEGSEDEIFAALSTGTHAPLPDTIPARLREIVERLLQPMPADRFASAEQLLFALNAGACVELGKLTSKGHEYETIDYDALEREITQPQPDPEPAPALSAPVTEPPPPARSARATRTAPRSRIATYLAIAIAGALLALMTQTLVSRVQSPPVTTISAATEAPSAATTRTTTTTTPQPDPDPAPTPEAVVPAQSPVLTTTSLPTAPKAAPAHSTTEATKRPEGTLQVGSVPPSRVWVDGTSLGWTNLTRRLPAGQHTVVLGKDPNDLKRSRTVVISPNQVSHVACTPFSCE